jgi:transcriptional regulator with XRE-family HTH domain
MTSFGTRLKAERHRLGLTQVEMAQLGDVAKGSQIAYEGDGVSPPAKYLARLAPHGVDIHYLFFGEYSNTGASRQIAELLTMLNQLAPPQQAMAFAVLSLFQRTPDFGQGGVEQADEIWRAARLFQKFLSMSKQGKVYLEKAAEIE